MALDVCPSREPRWLVGSYGQFDVSKSSKTTVILGGGSPCRFFSPSVWRSGEESRGQISWLKFHSGWRSYKEGRVSPRFLLNPDLWVAGLCEG